MGETTPLSDKISQDFTTMNYVDGICKVKDIKATLSKIHKRIIENKVMSSEAKQICLVIIGQECGTLANSEEEE